jgi:hypothetical protein
MPRSFGRTPDSTRILAKRLAGCRVPSGAKPVFAAGRHEWKRGEPTVSTEHPCKTSVLITCTFPVQVALLDT